MYTYELNKLLYFVKYLKAPIDHLDIRSHIQFAGNPTRLGTSSKLKHFSLHHFYFNRIVRLLNHLSVIDASFSIDAIKNQLIAYLSYLQNHYIFNFNSHFLCSYHISFAPAPNIQDSLFQ